MQLVSITVENYRSIKQAKDIRLGQNSVIIGANNEGKSNILRAISVAMGALSRRRLLKSPGPGLARYRLRSNRLSYDTYDRERDFPVGLKGTQRQKPTRMTLEFTLSQKDIEDFKAEIKSSINGTLPVCVSFHEDETTEIKIVKKGPGSTTLNQKSSRIADFLASRIQFHYIPAGRTADSATDIVSSLLSAELRTIESDPAIRKALEDIRNIQRPILESLSERVTKTVQRFIPSVKNILYKVLDEDRLGALHRGVSIEIDDGHATALESKGDGVQSLVALGMRHHAIAENRGTSSYIFAIEEPEVHLHPNAVHEIKSVLDALSTTDQIIITTHSPILVNRDQIDRNILVHNSSARPARNLTEIRKILGIKSYDNLTNADLVLLVEGEEDKIAIIPILSHYSNYVRKSLGSGRIIVEPTHGASKLQNRVAQYKSLFCKVHCFMDADRAGRQAIDATKEAGIISVADYQFALLSGRDETEFEDMINEEIYRDIFIENFGVDLSALRPRNKKQKWTARLRDIFDQSGRVLSDVDLARAKMLVSRAVLGAPGSAIKPAAEPLIQSLVTSLERKLEGQAGEAAA